MRVALAAFVSVLLASSAARAEPSRFGASTDLGIPDGIMAAFLFRPHRLVTTHVALGHNTNSPGLRIGVSFSPIDYAVEPYTALELGYYFEAETPRWMRDIAEEAGLDDKTLDRVGYKFVNGHLGLRVGNSTASVFLQGGVSFIDAKSLVIKPKPNFAPPVDLYRETVIHAWIISGRVGIAFYF